MVGSFQCRKVCKYSLPSSYYTLQRCCWGYRNGRCKNWGTGRCEKGPKWAMKERSINKRWLFIPIKAEYSPLSLAVQRLHLWLLSCSNYWLAGAFEKSTIKPGIWKKKNKTENCSAFSPRDCNWWGTTEQHSHWCVQSHSKLREQTTCLLFSYFLAVCSKNNCYRWL